MKKKISKGLRVAISYAVIILASYMLENLAFIPYDAVRSFGSLAFGSMVGTIFVTLMFVFLCKIFGEKPVSLLSVGEGRWSLIGVASIAICIAYVHRSILQNQWNRAYTAVLIYTAFVAYFEELIFRGMLCSYSMKLVRRPSRILDAVLVNGLIFGLMHLLNLLNGRPLHSTLIQVVSACCMGLLSGALFVRSKSIWPCFAMHFLNNCRINLAELSATETAMSVPLTTGDALRGSMIAAVKWILLFVFPAMFLLRDSRCGEVFRLWHRKNRTLTEDDDSMLTG